MELIEVVAGVIRLCKNSRGLHPNDCVLIAQRPEEKRHGGLWEFPGGKLESGESLSQALAREIKEELALTVESVSVAPIFQIQDPGSVYCINFLCCNARGQPILSEHQAATWVRVSDLLSFDLAPSDKRFAEFLKEWLVPA